MASASCRAALSKRRTYASSSSESTFLAGEATSSIAGTVIGLLTDVPYCNACTDDDCYCPLEDDDEVAEEQEFDMDVLHALLVHLEDHQADQRGNEHEVGKPQVPDELDLLLVFVHSEYDLQEKAHFYEESDEHEGKVNGGYGLDFRAVRLRMA